MDGEKLGIIPKLKDVLFLLNQSRLPASSMLKELQRAGLNKQNVKCKSQDMSLKIVQLDMSNQSMSGKSPESFTSEESSIEETKGENTKYTFLRNKYLGGSDDYLSGYPVITIYVQKLVNILMIFLNFFS